jgi:hypothetical protein
LGPKGWCFSQILEYHNVRIIKSFLTGRIAGVAGLGAVTTHVRFIPSPAVALAAPIIAVLAHVSAVRALL